MALFKQSGNNLSRAAAILATLNKAEGEETPPEGDQPLTGDQGQQPPVGGQDTPPAGEGAQEPTAPEGETPPEGNQGGEQTPPSEGTATSGEGEGGQGEGEGAGVAAAPTTTPGQPANPEGSQGAAEVSDDQLFSLLSERLGKEVKSLDDLKSPEAPELPTELQELKDWSERTGLPISKWSEYNRDFSKMSDMDIARETLARENPTFTQEELNYELQRFIFNEDDDQESDRIKKSIALKKFAKEGRSQLEQNRIQLTESAGKPVLTEQQKADLAFAQSARQQQQESQASQQTYNQKIAEAANALDSIDLKLSDDLTIKYNVPAEVKSSLPELVGKMPSWYNEDGSYNHENIVRDVTRATQIEAIVQAAFQQGISVGKEGQIKQGGNLDLEGNKPPVTGESKKKGNVDAVIEGIIGAKKRSPLAARFGKK